MAKVRRMDHVGIIVRDLEVVQRFFTDLGLEVFDAQELSGAVFDRVNALAGVQVSMCFLRTPDGSSNIELIQFHAPLDQRDAPTPAVNTPGIRHVAFVVDDLDATLEVVRAHGGEPFSTVERFDNGYALCLVHGPEGIIVELAQEIA